MSFATILNRLSPPNKSDYALLPTQSAPLPHHHHHHHSHHCHHSQQHNHTSWWNRMNVTGIPRRYTRTGFGLFIGLILYLVFFGHFRHPPELLETLDSDDPLTFPAESWATLDGKPPTYRQYLEYEKHLPAHDEDLSYPDGKHAKFIYFGNHQWGVGWGNVLQEMIYNAFFAYHVKRSFVFYNYSWSRIDPEFSKYHDRLIPSRIPLTALISGPMVGGPMGKDDVDVPRAVSLDYFNQVCPESDRYVFSESEVNKILDGSNPTASQLLTRLSDKVNNIDASCIEIPQSTHQIFNFMVFGSKRILDTWDLVRKSPVYTKFGWSPLVHAAYHRNRQFFEVKSRSIFSSLFSPVINLFSSLFSSSSSSSSSSEPPSSSLPSQARYTSLEPPFKPLPGLLVLHIRRGDYKEHCSNFVEYKSEFNGYNSFDELPDHFIPPHDDDNSHPSEESVNIYMKHCFPTIAEIIDRVTQVKQRVKGLKKVYIMTNGNRSWLSELKKALMAADSGWETVATSRDLVLSWEQKPISQALDMYVGERAQAFIGNGFSSMTSNIVMFRIGNPGLRPNDTFFW